MLLNELNTRLSNNFIMDIKETYHSFDIDNNTNIFIESFDNKYFEVIKMDKNSLEMETIIEIEAYNNKDLNKQLNETLNKIYDFV